MINEKDWLDRMTIAAEVYIKDYQGHKPEIERFISWLYKQYGYPLPKKDVKE